MTKKKNKSGRPQIVLTDEQIVKVKELSAYLNCEQIAEYFSFSEDTFYELKKRDPRILRAYKKGKAEKIYRYAKKLENKAMGIDEAGDTTAIIFYLKTQAGWSTEHKNDNKPKFKFSDNKTPIGILDTALSAFENGEITIAEARSIGDLAIAKVNVTKMIGSEEEVITKQRTWEELREEVYVLSKVIDHVEKQNAIKEKEELSKVSN